MDIMEKKVLASVDGKEIYDSDLDRIIEKYPTDKRIYFDTFQGRKQLLEQKTAFTVFGKYCRELGMDKTEEFKEKISDIIDQMLTQTYLAGLFSEVSADEDEALAFYNENPDKFAVEETVSAKHILVDEEELAKDIKSRLDSGEITFEDAADKYSKCPSKERGGSLGYFKRGMMVKEFEDAAFAQPLGVVGEPVKSQFGWHIIVTEDKTEPGTLDFGEVKEKLTAQIKEKKQQDIYEQKYSELKEKYSVKFFEE